MTDKNLRAQDTQQPIGLDKLSRLIRAAGSELAHPMWAHRAATRVETSLAGINRLVAHHAAVRAEALLLRGNRAVARWRARMGDFLALYLNDDAAFAKSGGWTSKGEALAVHIDALFEIDGRLVVHGKSDVNGSPLWVVMNSHRDLATLFMHRTDDAPGRIDTQTLWGRNVARELGRGLAWKFMPHEHAYPPPLVDKVLTYITTESTSLMQLRYTLLHLAPAQPRYT